MQIWRNSCYEINYLKEIRVLKSLIPQMDIIHVIFFSTKFVKIEGFRKRSNFVKAFNVYVRANIFFNTLLCGLFLTKLSNHRTFDKRLKRDEISECVDVHVSYS